jgi:phage major head subunit gpT-like protein
MSTSLSNKISDLQEAINTSLLESLAKPVDSVYNQIATVIPSTAKTTNLPVGLPLSDMTHQLAESQTLSGIDIDSVAVTAKRYSTGFLINVDDLEDNGPQAVIDIYSAKLRELSNKAAKFYDKLVIDYLVSNPTTFTGEALFADSQTWGRGATAQDNLLGLALSDVNLITALGNLKTFKDHLGQVIGQSGTINLVVPPQLEFTAKALVNTSLVSAGGTNILQGAANVVVSPYLSDANDWYLTVGNDQLFVVERMAPTVMISKDERSENVLVNVKLRAGMGVGCWSSFIKSVQ